MSATNGTRDRRDEPAAAVDLYWIPLGAGQHVVMWSGKIYEALVASIQGRPRYDLYHSALIVSVPGSRYVIEQAPVIDGHGERRGVVVEGPVGSRMASRLRVFRYEVRLWRDGTIPDIREAVSSPVRVSQDPDQASLVLDLTAAVPPSVWGRDERRTGDMWNSNSVVSWLLASAGIDAVAISPPARGRAPGWRAGLVVAHGDMKLSTWPPVLPKPVSPARP